VASLFPAKFTLLNVDDPHLGVEGVYDFAPALSARKLRKIASIAEGKTVQTYAVPIEDLIISKLWPTFEPSTIHDLLLLLACEEATHIDLTYFRERLRETPLAALCKASFVKFIDVYRHTAWYHLSGDTETLENTLRAIESALLTRRGPARNNM